MSCNIFSSFGSNALTISGEVMITPKRDVDISILTSFDRSGLKNILKEIKSRYKFLQVDTIDSLLEIDIKFYCQNKFFSNSQFLDDFVENLRQLVMSINENEESNLSVRINMFGVYINNGKKSKFRILNKEDDVRFMITDEDELTLSEKLNQPKFVNILAAVIVMFVVGYKGYQMYQNNELPFLTNNAKQSDSQVVDKNKKSSGADKADKNNEKQDKNLEIKDKKNTSNDADKDKAKVENTSKQGDVRSKVI